MTTDLTYRLSAGAKQEHAQSLGRRGVAALEFAMMAPALIFLLMFMYDAANGWITWQRLTQAARSVAQIATMLAVDANGKNILSPDQAWRASTAAYAAMPEMLSAGATYGVVMTEVLFTAPASCKGKMCVANVAWSKTSLGVAPSRVCGTLSAVSDIAPPSPSVLPLSAFQAAPLLVVDVTYTFKPLFLGSLIGSIPMMWSAYLPVRSGSVDQTISYDDSAVQCPPSPSPSKAANSNDNSQSGPDAHTNATTKD